MYLVVWAFSLWKNPDELGALVSNLVRFHRLKVALEGQVSPQVVVESEIQVSTSSQTLVVGVSLEIRSILEAEVGVKVLAMRGVKG